MNIKKLLTSTLLANLVFFPLLAQTKYTNPVFNEDTPDPSVERAPDGSFYVYSTGQKGRKSTDLVNWRKINNVIGRPTWNDTTYVGDDGQRRTDYYSFWACDVTRVKDKYLMYYACAYWGNGTRTGIGVATSNNPDRFTDRGRLFRSTEIGVHNSIDPCYVEEGDKKYLIWGSFHGIYLTELTDDGLAVKDPSKLIRLAGGAFEGAMIYKRGNYYYLFCSVGSCCEGVNSTYRTVVGRSSRLTGPYVNRQGGDMKNNNYTTIIQSNDRWKGPGHNSEIITDDEGQDWLLYHGYDALNPGNGRVLLLDKINWDKNNWPVINDGTPTTTEQDGPVFYDGDGANVTYKAYNTDLHLSAWDGWDVSTTGETTALSGLGTVYTPIGSVQGVGTFNIEQRITGLPNGIYELKTNSVAVDGGVEFVMNGLATDAYDPSEDGKNISQIPNAISGLFQRGQYAQSVYGLVLDGKLTFGMRSKGSLTDTQRFHIANVNLIRRDKNMDAARSLQASYTAVADTLIGQGLMFEQALKTRLAQYNAQINESEDADVVYDNMTKIALTCDSLRESIEAYKALNEQVTVMSEEVENAIQGNYVSQEAQDLLAEAIQASTSGNKSTEEVRELIAQMENVTHDMNYAYQEGDGTEANPYVIVRPSQLDNMRNVMIPSQMVYFKMDADVDMTGFNWQPLNTADNRYRNWFTLDGQGHLITNLQPDSTVAYASFAGTLCGQVRNVGFVNASIRGKLSGAGILCGYMGHSTFKDEANNMYPVIVENCYFTGSVKAQGYVGGLTGILYGSPATIKNCYTAVDVETGDGTANYGGGIFGRVRSEITMKRCYSAGNVTSSNAGCVWAGGQTSTTAAGDYEDIIAWGAEVNGAEGKTAIVGNLASIDISNNLLFVETLMLNGEKVTDGMTHSALQQEVATWGAPWHSDPTAGNGYPILEWQYKRGDYKQMCGFTEGSDISTVSPDTPQKHIITDLQGRRVEKPTKGVYIVNGKKILY